MKKTEKFIFAWADDSLPVLPYLSYRFTPKGDNWSYGLAALIFAALEFDKR